MSEINNSNNDSLLVQLLENDPTGSWNGDDLVAQVRMEATTKLEQIRSLIHQDFRGRDLKASDVQDILARVKQA